MPDVSVRAERDADYDEINGVVCLAFKREDHGQLVRDIRASPEYIPELALVAVDGDRVVGHVMVSHAELHNDGTREVVAMLSPLAVHPDQQGKGIGGALVREVVARADALGEPLVVLEGSPLYYPRFGFRPSVPLGITLPIPDWAPAEAGMVIPLAAYRPDLRGNVVYPNAFNSL